jgi:hypothetical protein
MAVHADMIPANVAGCLTERRAGDWAPSNAAAPLGGQLAARRGRAGAQNEGMRNPQVDLVFDRVEAAPHCMPREGLHRRARSATRVWRAPQGGGRRGETITPASPVIERPPVKPSRNKQPIRLCVTWDSRATPRAITNRPSGSALTAPADLRKCEHAHSFIIS